MPDMVTWDKKSEYHQRNQEDWNLQKSEFKLGRLISIVNAVILQSCTTIYGLQIHSTDEGSDSQIRESKPRKGQPRLWSAAQIICPCLHPRETIETLQRDFTRKMFTR